MRQTVNYLTASQSQPLPRFEPQPAPAPAPVGRLAAVERICTVQARYQGRQQRRVNGPALMAMGGVMLILVGLLAYQPCLVVLAFVIGIRMRRTFYRLGFPGEQVTTWNYACYDHEQGTSFSAVIVDPQGVAPVEHSRVRIRGRQRGNYFSAQSILWEADANGVPVAGRDGLVARQVPPVWLGAVLMGMGLILTLPFWLG